VKGRGGGRRSRAAMSKGEETNTHVFQMQKPAMILRDNGLLIHSDHQMNALDVTKIVLADQIFLQTKSVYLNNINPHATVNALTKCRTSMLTESGATPSIPTSKTLPAASPVLLLLTISCLLEY
jgi:hypothetical protein